MASGDTESLMMLHPWNVGTTSSLGHFVIRFYLGTHGEGFYQERHESVAFSFHFRPYQCITTTIVDSPDKEASDSTLAFLLKLINPIVEFESGVYIRKPDMNRVAQG